MIIEYIWIDGTQPTAQLRSKTRVLPNKHARRVGDILQAIELATRDDGTLPEGLENAYLGPNWGADGSSTNQAQGSDSDIILVPCCAIKDPFRKNGYLNLCEVFQGDGNPHPSNKRYQLRDLLKEGAFAFKPWLGLEQEYTLLSRVTSVIGLESKRAKIPFGFEEQSRDPKGQGPYYCGVGYDNIYGRDIYEKFLVACEYAGIALTGANWEVMPGQAEFQVSAPEALLTCDHLWLARWILHRISEECGVIVSLDPKPAEGDWNGAGMHANFSTEGMRGPYEKGSHRRGGMDAIKTACDQLGQNVDRHLKVYGHNYQARLTGDHETCSFEEFRWGVADRTASVRIPRQVEIDGYGYLEDRRPNANADPYEVASALIETICRL